MASRFMKIKKIVLPTITVFIIASQLMGCSCASQDEMLDTINNNKEIEIEVAELGFTEQGEETKITWTSLDKLVSYSSFRESMDEVLGIKSLNSTKYGIAYVGLDGNQLGNNTLYNAFMNEAFVKNYWNNEEVQSKVNALSVTLYADVEDGTKDSVYASINAYWNLLPDNTNYYFNGGASLTRGEAMALVARAKTQVTDSGKPDSNVEFSKAVGSSDYTDYANYVSNNSYLSISDKSLNNQTFNGTMTRGEYIYLVTTAIFGSDIETTSESLKDCKDGGDIAKEQKYSGDYADSYELNYAVKHADDGAPTKLYNVIAFAKANGIIGEETRWDEAVTKTEALELLVNTLNAYTTKNGFKLNNLGETAGEKMRETAKATYQSIANQLTVDENTYVSEYILLIDQGKEQSEVESTLLNKYKKEEESSKRQENENQGLAEQHTTNPLANGVKMEGLGAGYVEICGTKVYIGDNGYIYREDKTTLVTQDEFEEIISGSDEFTVRPIDQNPPAPTEPEVPEPTTLSQEQQSEKDHWQELINQGSEDMSGGIQVPTSDFNH